MGNLFKIAFRNLMRYRRRTIMTAILITIGISAVLLFSSIAGSFKDMMVGQVTDSMLGHLQVHSKGYLASIDNLPLNKSLKPEQVKKVTQLLESDPAVESYSLRVRFGSGFSNFAETTNIRMNAVDPDAEARTCPLLPGRLGEIKPGSKWLETGKVLIPQLIAQGMKIKAGDSVALFATNKDGSVNGMSFEVGGVMESVTGPGGRDGYMHIDDARALLRMESDEVSEIAVRVKDFAKLGAVMQPLQAALEDQVNAKGKPVYEIHDWEKLSPFSNIAGMIDMLMLFVNIMLVAIVLVSVLNVMIMAVYERVKEIGTISAMGVKPRKVMFLFVIEGFLLGLIGTFVGSVISVVTIFVLNTVNISFDFGRQTGLVLEPSIDLWNLLFTGLLVISVSVLASLQPAHKASKMEPVDALRHV